MAVPIQTRPTFQHGPPKRLLEWPYYSAEEGRAYDVSWTANAFWPLKRYKRRTAPALPLHELMSFSTGLRN
jgi:hypothetical protein